MDDFKIIYKLLLNENIKWGLFFYSPMSLTYYNNYGNGENIFLIIDNIVLNNFVYEHLL